MIVETDHFHSDKREVFSLSHHLGLSNAKLFLKDYRLSLIYYNILNLNS